MASTPEWLDDGEEVLLVKGVALNKAQYAGKLYVTSSAVRFHASVEMGEETVHHFTDKLLTLPYTAIRSVEAVKKFFIFNSLRLSPKDGKELNFWFGVLSPEKFENAIKQRLG